MACRRSIVTDNPVERLNRMADYAQKAYAHVGSEPGDRQEFMACEMWWVIQIAETVKQLQSRIK